MDRLKSLYAASPSVYPVRLPCCAACAHARPNQANLAHYQNSAVSSAKLKQRRPVVIANISAMT